MKSSSTIIFVWIALLSLTSISALFAEQMTLTVSIIITICSIVMIKGIMVIDYLMGLKYAPAHIRWLMIMYFLTIPVFIAFCVIYPETIALLTTL